MMIVTLTRVNTCGSGTFGELVAANGFKCRTGELPWKNNQSNKSCIPAGDYNCIWIESPKHGECYCLQGVPDRTAIEIHVANFCGSTDEGYKSDLLGCIALGQKVGMLEGQVAILESHPALVAFEAAMGKQSFLLQIRWTDELFKNLQGPQGR